MKPIVAFKRNVCFFSFSVRCPLKTMRWSQWLLSQGESKASIDSSMASGSKAREPSLRHERLLQGGLNGQDPSRSRTVGPCPVVKLSNSDFILFVSSSSFWKKSGQYVYTLIQAQQLLASQKRLPMENPRGLSPAGDRYGLGQDYDQSGHWEISQMSRQVMN